ncbi:MAG TPA: polysaccharide biosynthesis tyrosine autokinase [Methylocystis sp.]|nr:polysaccharide biosynthesis tyrosine autokinase [Methylocystis sp.]
MNDKDQNHLPAASGPDALAAPSGRGRPPLPEATGYGASFDHAPTESEKFRANVLEYWRIILKWRYVFLGCAGAFLALGALLTLQMTPLYTATARLQIDRNTTKVMEGGNIIPLEGTDFEFLKTQYELLQGRAIAERVVSTLRLDEDPTFLAPKGASLLGAIRNLWSPSTPASQAVEREERTRAAIDLVFLNRAIKPLPGSRLVDASFTDPSPERAQKAAQALAEAFIAANLDKRFQANAYAKQFLEDQLKQLQLRLQDSEKALLDFGQKEQIVSTTEKTSIAENNLSAANAALGALVAERIKNEQLYKQVEQTAAVNLPQFLTNKVIEGLRDKHNALVAEYQEKLETFKPNYPTMVQINNKIAEIDRQIAAEVKTIKASYKGAYVASLNQENEMKARIDSLRAEFLDLQKRSIQYNILKREVDTNRSLYESLLQRYKEVDVASGVGTNNVFIVERAQTPTQQSSPLVGRNMLIALMLGALAGGLAALTLERLDDSIASTEELERMTRLPTLGVIPRIYDALSVEKELQDIRSGLCEAYRSTCTSLHLSTDSGLPRTLLVTSAAPSEGKSITALAIARHFALMGLKVLIIDADMRKPSLHLKLRLDNGVGLSNCLTGGCSPPQAMVNTTTPNLIFLPSGPLPPNAADLLLSARLTTLLAAAQTVFDLVVLDGPPVMGLADAQLLAHAAAATIFVVKAGSTRKAHIREALKRLRFSRANLVGCLLASQDMRKSGHGYGYGYNYGYGYGYGDVTHRGHAIPGPQESRAHLASAADDDRGA